MRLMDGFDWKDGALVGWHLPFHDFRDLKCIRLRSNFGRRRLAGTIGAIDPNTLFSRSTGITQSNAQALNLGFPVVEPVSAPYAMKAPPQMLTR